MANSLTDTEKYLLTRAYALAIKLKDTEKTCAARVDACKMVPAQDLASLPWDASKFWKVVGPSGDSMSLVAASDMAIVFYRSSKAETPTSMGRWTQVELAHLKKQGVPFIFVDIDTANLKADMDAALTNEVLTHPLVKAALGRR